VPREKRSLLFLSEGGKKEKGEGGGLSYFSHEKGIKVLAFFVKKKEGATHI